MNLHVVDCESGKAPLDSGESEPSQIGLPAAVPPIAEIQAYAFEIQTRPKALQQLRILYLAFASAPIYSRIQYGEEAEAPGER
jgi:hypothetical protein